MKTLLRELFPTLAGLGERLAKLEVIRVGAPTREVETGAQPELLAEISQDPIARVALVCGGIGARADDDEIERGAEFMVRLPRGGGAEALAERVSIDLPLLRARAHAAAVPDIGPVTGALLERIHERGELREQLRPGQAEPHHLERGQKRH